MEPGHAAEGQPTAPRCDGAGDPGRCSSAEAEIGFREILEQVEWKSVQGGGVGNVVKGGWWLWRACPQKMLHVMG